MTETASGGSSREPGDRGRTTIADGVVEKIAGLAAREVVGVHAMGSGSGLSRTFGAVRDRVPGGGKAGVSRGVKAEVGETQTALDLEIVVDYGVSIRAVARAVRENVISAVELLAAALGAHRHPGGQVPRRGPGPGGPVPPPRRPARVRRR
ncbi:Asp23/Gls24 family envelope stress response protein [Streptomyces sp. NPDC006459]|uniref:Asp23/Gls24 family envelope stress response protein n=1 Tax=Streptomyces sp. NPDC006459 TaxID=3154303 RepID=UPI0033B493DA